MADRLIDIAGQVRLHAPLATAELVRTWVNKGVRTASSRRSWGFLRLFGQFVTRAQKTGLVTANFNSTVLIGPGGLTPFFAQSDVGRQIRVGQLGPPYTILEVDLISDTATIDIPYGPPSVVAAQTRIMDAYIMMPKEFNRFLGVLDPVNNWQLYWYVTEQELNQWDAKRVATTTPWAMVSRGLSQVPNFVGFPVYELWPYGTTDKFYPWIGIRQPKTMGVLDEFEGTFAWRSDVFLTYALYEAASWPGPSFDKKNIYFNPQIAAQKKREFEEEIWTVEQRDDETFPTLLETVSWINRPFAPLDSRFMQEHDAVGLGLVQAY